MPSRKKKQKTKHGETGDPLSQSEIWDDSALIRSWNDALAEYDYYHSIHARGEDVEEILRKAEMGEFDEGANGEQHANAGWQPVDSRAETSTVATEIDGSSNVATVGRAQVYDSDEDEEGEINDDDAPVDEEPQLLLDKRRKAAMQHFESQSDISAQQQQEQRDPSKSMTNEDQPSTFTTAPTIRPSAMSNGQAPPFAPSQNHTLENVKMAYYWAGYYSGLHDGQRQAQNPGPG